MPFNSLPFILFFASFFLLYWRVFSQSLTLRNLFILAGSYFFYAWWDWRFLLLLIGNTVLTWLLALRIGKTDNERHRDGWFGLGLAAGLGCLFFFKYYNFFAASLNSAAASLGVRLDMHILHVILPLGISFYTFRTISYLIDVKRNKTEPVRDWLVFSCYVAFFPCLTAGPIDRAGTLVPQLQTKKAFDYDQAVDGMRQILWGLFKKLVIADNCALFTNGIFDQYKSLPGSSLLFGTLLFPVQLYADFSGYSDIAIGIASLLGFNVTRNFAYPFFAQNIVDYWRRWHMSLTSWLTDYVFTPVSIQLRDNGKLGVITAVILTFTAIGIWHGANWTYVLYGFLNGCFFIPAILRGTMNKREKAVQAGASFSPRAFLNRIGNFLLVAFTLVIFRADNISQAFGYYGRMGSRSLLARPALTERPYALVPLVFIALMLAAEWRQRDKRHALEIGFVKAFYIRAFIYLGLVGGILVFSATRHAEFIYFKF